MALQGAPPNSVTVHGALQLTYSFRHAMVAPASAASKAVCWAIFTPQLVPVPQAQYQLAAL